MKEISHFPTLQQTRSAQGQRIAFKIQRAWTLVVLLLQKHRASTQIYKNDTEVALIILLRWRWSARLKHSLCPSSACVPDKKHIGIEYLCHFESHTSSSLPISNSEIGREAGMSDYGRQRIPVLMCQPLAECMDECKKRMRDICALFAEICMA